MKKFGMTGLLNEAKARTGKKVSAPTARMLCAERVLRPTVSDVGWRMFSERDVERLCSWIEQREQSA